jgi:hypothetical protein
MAGQPGPEVYPARRRGRWRSRIRQTGDRLHHDLPCPQARRLDHAHRNASFPRRSAPPRPNTNEVETPYTAAGIHAAARVTKAPTPAHAESQHHHSGSPASHAPSIHASRPRNPPEPWRSRPAFGVPWHPSADEGANRPAAAYRQPPNTIRSPAGTCRSGRPTAREALPAPAPPAQVRPGGTEAKCHHRNPILPSRVPCFDRRSILRIRFISRPRIARGT